MRKIALKIQRAERSLDSEERKRGRTQIKHLPTCQKIIIVPSVGSVTDLDNDDPFYEQGVILANGTADYLRKSPRVSCWMTRRPPTSPVFFACERLVVNPPALTEDCPRLRVNEVRMESRWAPDRRQKKKEKKGLDSEDQWLCLIPWTNNNNIQKKELNKKKNNLLMKLRVNQSVICIVLVFYISFHSF